MKHGAFDQLVAYLKDIEETQYSLTEIQRIFTSYLSDETPYTDKWLKKKLKDYFGDKIIIIEGEGKRSPILTFKENAYAILREEWKNRKLMIFSFLFFAICRYFSAFILSENDSSLGTTHNIRISVKFPRDLVPL